MSYLEPERCMELLRETVAEIAETMLFIEIVPGEAMPAAAVDPSGYRAIIGYSGAIEGSLQVSGSKSSVLKLASSLLGEVRDEMDAEMRDAFGELGNLIAGGVQSRLDAEVGVINMSPPSLLDMQTTSQELEPAHACVSHRFVLDGESFFVEIFYDSAR